MVTLKLKKSGRVCYPFNWESGSLPKPWPNTHSRVMIPLTAAERKHSNKKCHIQIVNNENLEVVKQHNPIH